MQGLLPRAWRVARLALAELEVRASAWLAVLLTLDAARVTGDKASPLQLRLPDEVWQDKRVVQKQ